MMRQYQIICAGKRDTETMSEQRLQQASSWTRRRDEKERRLQAMIGGFVGPPRTLGRHGARLQLAYDLLPQFWMRPGLSRIEPFERQTAGLQTLVMARDAVLVESGAI